MRSPKTKGSSPCRVLVKINCTRFWQPKGLHFDVDQTQLCFSSNVFPTIVPQIVALRIAYRCIPLTLGLHDVFCAFLLALHSLRAMLYSISVGPVLNDPMSESLNRKGYLDVLELLRQKYRFRKAKIFLQ